MTVTGAGRPDSAAANDLTFLATPAKHPNGYLGYRDRQALDIFFSRVSNWFPSRGR
jgi:hypothetical protein